MTAKSRFADAALRPSLRRPQRREFDLNLVRMCCEQHPLALDCAFFERVLLQGAFSVGTISNPYQLGAVARMWADANDEADLSGEKLMVWPQN